jgi:putative acyl-CoA dehydrogenase
MATTHEVFNQPTPLVDYNLYATNRPLRDALAFHLPGSDEAPRLAQGPTRGWPTRTRRCCSATTASAAASTRSSSTPATTRCWARRCATGLHGSALVGGPGAHVERAAAFMLFTEAEPSVLCPVSMSYAVTPALRANRRSPPGRPLASTATTRASCPSPTRPAVTMGMGMTEKQGGSDVRANTTRAELRRRRLGRALPHHRPQVVLLGADVRRLPGAGADRRRPELLLPAAPAARRHGQRHRRAAPEAQAGQPRQRQLEVEFLRASAWLVGDEGRGVAQILAMGALTRLDCALGTAGLMRQALSLALHHTAQRQAFGKRLIEQPMMKNVLADLALESEAATALALRLARAVDRTEHGQDADGFEA